MAATAEKKKLEVPTDRIAFAPVQPGDIVLWWPQGSQSALTAIVNKVNRSDDGEETISVHGFDPYCTTLAVGSAFMAHAIPHRSDIATRERTNQRCGFWDWTEREKHNRNMLMILEERIDELSQ